MLLDLPHLDVEGPGIVLLLGATGSGKSSLLRSATGLSPNLWGANVRGTFAREGDRVGYVPQDALDGFLSYDPEQEFVLRLRAGGIPLREAREEARRRLVPLGLPDATPILRLSAGQRRRLLLAAIGCHGPTTLLLDEPFNHVDKFWQPRLQKAIEEAGRESLVVLATHDPRPWLAAARHVIVIRGGQVAYDGPPNGLRAPDFPELRMEAETAPPGRAAAAGEHLVLENVAYEVDQKRILDGISLVLGPGLHVLAGPNGAGKTTLLRLAAGLIRPTRGGLRIAGRPALAGQNLVHRVTLQFEEPGAAFFAATGHEELAFTPVNQGLPACDVRARLSEVTADFDLDAFLERHPQTLSGGERERLALGCVQAAHAPVILLDEPTQGLDAAGRRILYAFLERAGRDRCILAATHDPELIARAGAVHRLEDGRLLAPAMEGIPRIPS